MACPCSNWWPMTCEKSKNLRVFSQKSAKYSYCLILALLYQLSCNTGDQPTQYDSLFLFTWQNQTLWTLDFPYEKVKWNGRNRGTFRMPKSVWWCAIFHVCLLGKVKWVYFVLLTPILSVLLPLHNPILLSSCVSSRGGPMNIHLNILAPMISLFYHYYFPCTIPLFQHHVFVLREVKWISFLY